MLPDAGATLTQIFFGVADLIAVAAALYVLLPSELGLDYLEVLAIFMASIVVGLVSHVPGSLGVFESAVVLLIQPSEEQTLPLIGALLAFRAVYYLLPLLCGVLLLAVSELHRWRMVLLALADRCRIDPDQLRARLRAPAASTTKADGRSRGAAIPVDRAAPSRRSHTDTAEDEALRILIHQRDDIVDRLAPILFASPRRRIAFELLRDEKELHAAIDAAPDPVRDLLMRLAVEEPDGDPDHAVADLSRYATVRELDGLRADAAAVTDMLLSAGISPRA